MSQYLTEQMEKMPNIRLRTRTVLERVEGDGRVERVTLTQDDGASEVEDIDAVFVFIGTKPRSDRLPPNVLRDSRGFVITGRDLSGDERHTKCWKERLKRWRSRPCARYLRRPATSRRSHEPGGVSRR